MLLLRGRRRHGGGGRRRRIRKSGRRRGVRRRGGRGGQHQVASLLASVQEAHESTREKAVVSVGSLASPPPARVPIVHGDHLVLAQRNLIVLVRFIGVQTECRHPFFVTQLTVTRLSVRSVCATLHRGCGRRGAALLLLATAALLLLLLLGEDLVVFVRSHPRLKLVLIDTPGAVRVRIILLATGTRRRDSVTSCTCTGHC
mmetsp:Transcript_6174/g.15658  ORF Transcript_6174/g.15658 Transcript_6174/m.15658 type:complete len:201 (+) Transcript_6174:1553-2155(+)